ncbi:MAG: hypothetical protein HFG75_07905 [Hungatella sp.]|nr:hypothetical protein [Hungatella sp.]
MYGENGILFSKIKIFIIYLSNDYRGYECSSDVGFERAVLPHGTTCGMVDVEKQKLGDVFF